MIFRGDPYGGGYPDDFLRHLNDDLWFSGYFYLETANS